MNLLPITTRKLIFLASLLLSLTAGAVAEERDFSAAFGSNTGTFVLYDAARGQWLHFHPEECRVRMSPCSTFKVLNSLIALETGVASGPDFALPWDGKQRSFEAWNRDQTLRSAFATSCVWYFQELARRIGLPRYEQIVPQIHYGNNDVSGGVTQFWLQTSLAISPDEQVDFLRRLHARELPFSAPTVDTVLDIMTLSRIGQTIFRGKTGTGFDGDAMILGWFVGSVTTPAGDYYFATRITGKENASGLVARQITETILTTLKLLPAAK